MANGYSILDRAETAPADRFASLRTELDRLTARAVRRGRIQRAVDELPRATGRALPLLVISPFALLVFRLLWAMSTTAPWPMSGGVAFAIVFLPYVGSILAQMIAASAASWSRASALAWLDERLQLADRLTSADEFLKSSDRSGFMLAALEQTTAVTQKALETPLWIDQWQAEFPKRLWIACAYAALILIVIGYLPSREGEVAPAGPAPREAVARIEADREKDGEAPPIKRNAESQPVRERPQATTMPSKATVNRDTSEKDDVKEEKRSEGLTKQGETASAGAPSGSAAAKGQPTSQGQQSKPQPPGKRVDRKPKEQQQKNEAAAPKKETKENSGSTMSRGASGGATKNPVASDWSTKDEVQLPEDEPLRDDENVEDDDTGDQSRGGLQPNLRDRRPPPNRDLSISFGSGKNPGNGRGGPSAQKKQRGTASLVFGVPIPDHVRGKLNPGTTKVTQERVEPRPEDAANVQASDRAPRTEAGGFLPEDTLTPEMRNLLKLFSLRMRREAVTEEKK